MNIVENRRTKFVIQIRRASGAADTFAAELLQEYLAKITGCTLPIRTDNNRYGHALMVGNAEGGMVTAGELAGLADDGYIIKTSGGSMQLTGRTPRGVIYAVVAYLRDCLGVRVFAPDEEYVPRLDVLPLKNTNAAYSPPFEYRDQADAHTKDAHYAVFNNLNGIYNKLEAKHGGFYEIGGFCHTFPRLVGPDEYFAAHPEYFALIGGERRAKPAQLCFSNPELVPLLTEKVLKWKRQRPDLTIFSLVQADGYHFCECAACKQIEERTGGRGGPMFALINAVARDVAKEYPDIMIDTLAYLHTRRPPKNMTFEANVMIRLCSIENCAVHPLGECAWNSDRHFNKSYPPIEYKQELKDWAALTDRLQVFDYPVNNNHGFLPVPNFHLIQHNLRFERDAGIKGVFLCSCYTVPYNSFGALKSYLYARLMYNPDLDYNTLETEFLTAYYGAAAPVVKEILTYMEQRLKTHDFHMIFATPPTRDPSGYYGADFQDDMEKLFVKALSLVTDEKYRLRLKREALCAPLLRALFMKKGDPQFSQKIEAFFGLAHSLGIYEFCESDEKSERGYRLRMYLQNWFFEEFDRLDYWEKQAGIVPYAE